MIAKMPNDVIEWIPVMQNLLRAVAVNQYFN